MKSEDNGERVHLMEKLKLREKSCLLQDAYPRIQANPKYTSKGLISANGDAALKMKV